jgi:hypothetical protein
VSEWARLTMDRLVREPGWSGYRCVVSRLTSVRKFPFLEFALVHKSGRLTLIGDSSIRTFYALRELAHTPALGGHSLILIVPCFFAA